MFKKKKMVTSLVASSMVAVFSLSPLAEAHTYIINNEETNKEANASFIGNFKENRLKNNTIDTIKAKNLQSYQEDKVFKAPKEKTPITDRTRKSENALSNSKLEDTRVFTTVNMQTNANE
ncbi:hypothetical protein [Staphylococcus chromogenes]|nr:hypothetical protein [Staphylococcus chromogenes]MDU0450794.1 hypothetical protein [Staphylococcus chromogenes]